VFVRTALLVLRKDFTIEVKSREILYTTILFALACVLVFSIAFVKEGEPLGDAAAGILWIAIEFAGTLALARTFERERYNETLRALLLAPTSRAAIYVGKMLGILALLCVLELLLVPLVAILFRAPLVAQPVLLGALLVTGSVGFASVGTLFAAMLVRTQSRDVMLPILLYPITIPVMIAGVRGTVALLGSPPDTATVTMWVSILTTFDVVFVTLSLWTFGVVMTE
jgi:heme exporter protein CcmB